MPSKWVTINFELVRLINRTCNFRTETYIEPCETSKMELFCENSYGFRPFIMSQKSSIMTRSWIRLCRSSHLKGVLENRYSQIFSQNPQKIPMKKFIFSKVAGWQSPPFSRVPWGFYLLKKFVKIAFCWFVS